MIKKIETQSAFLFILIAFIAGMNALPYNYGFINLMYTDSAKIDSLVDMCDKPTAQQTVECVNRFARDNLRLIDGNHFGTYNAKTLLEKEEGLCRDFVNFYVEVLHKYTNKNIVVHRVYMYELRHVIAIASIREKDIETYCVLDMNHPLSCGGYFPSNNKAYILEDNSNNITERVGEQE